MKILVTPAELAADTGAIILDATYHALEPERHARNDYYIGHIPGALFLDLEHLSDRSSTLPSMAPPAHHQRSAASCCEATAPRKTTVSR